MKTENLNSDQADVKRLAAKGAAVEKFVEDYGGIVVFIIILMTLIVTMIGMFNN